MIRPAFQQSLHLLLAKDAQREQIIAVRCRLDEFAFGEQRKPPPQRIWAALSELCKRSHVQPASGPVFDEQRQQDIPSWFAQDMPVEPLKALLAGPQDRPRKLHGTRCPFGASVGDSPISNRRSGPVPLVAGYRSWSMGTLADIPNAKLAPRSRPSFVCSRPDPTREVARLGRTSRVPEATRETIVAPKLAGEAVI